MSLQQSNSKIQKSVIDLSLVDATCVADVDSRAPDASRGAEVTQDHLGSRRRLREVVAGDRLGFEVSTLCGKNDGQLVSQFWLLLQVVAREPHPVSKT